MGIDLLAKDIVWLIGQMALQWAAYCSRTNEHPPSRRRAITHHIVHKGSAQRCNRYAQSRATLLLSCLVGREFWIVWFLCWNRKCAHM